MRKSEGEKVGDLMRSAGMLRGVRRRKRAICCERPPLVIEDDETCAYCAGYKTEIAELKAVLAEDLLDRMKETQQ
mgnify:CR=1 FL=1